jgi:hypothetical protein
MKRQPYGVDGGVGSLAFMFKLDSDIPKDGDKADYLAYFKTIDSAGGELSEMLLASLDLAWDAYEEKVLKPAR